MLIILVGKTGSGKTTVQDILTKVYNFKRVVTYTTRPRRDMEINGIDYFFVSDDTFRRMFETNNFLEVTSREVDDKTTYYFGSTKQNVTNDDYVIVLDAIGAVKYYEYYGDICSIVFLDVPDNLRQELVSKRGDFNESEWQTRFAIEDKFEEQLCRIPHRVIPCVAIEGGSLCSPYEIASRVYCTVANSR